MVGVIAGATVMAVTGPDAAAFLHGQLANDVSGLLVGAARRSLYLNHKGHALAEVMVLRRGRAAFELVEEGGAVEWVRAELERHVVFDDVILGRPDEAALVTVQGEGAARPVTGVLGAEPGSDGGVTTLEVPGLGSVSAWARRRSVAGGFDLLAASGAERALLDALIAAGAAPASAGEIDLMRVRAGIALAPHDAGEGVLPQEAGLEEALSYRKGCYLGQEIMARVEARGNLRRVLVRVRLAADPRTPGDRDGEWRELRSGGRVVGRLGTVAAAAGGWEALAVVRRDLAADAAIEAPGGVTVRVLP